MTARAILAIIALVTGPNSYHSAAPRAIDMPFNCAINAKCAFIAMLRILYLQISTHQCQL